MDRLQGKIAIVTGGASGIGEACVRLFVSEGATVIIADINADAARALAEELGTAAIDQYLDVTEEQHWTQCMQNVLSRFGKVDILVNNAGMGTGGFVEDEPVEGHKLTLDINVTGVWLGMRAVMPSMKKQGSGSIVNISSIDGLVGVAQLASYSASKFAVTGMTKSVALETGPYGVRVNSIHPGFIGTPMFNRTSAGNERYRHAISQQPIARAGRPDEVARAVLFFASDDSSFCTGSALVVDGGHTAGPHRLPL